MGLVTVVEGMAPAVAVVVPVPMVPGQSVRVLP